MFERILLLLDGSELSERSVPYAEELAGRLGSEVTLFHTCRAEEQQFHHMHQIYIDNMTHLVQREINKRWSRSGVRVQGEALIGEPVKAVCDYVKDKDIGLVVMVTHDGLGFSVIRAVSVPILLIRAKAVPQVKGRKRLINRILLPLDGSEAGKIALPFAEELAVKLKARVTLFRMTRSSYAYAGMEGMAPSVGVDFSRIDRTEERRIRAYLANVAEELRTKDIPVTHNTVLGTDPAYEIIELGKKVKADLVVMSTHGRSSLARWVLGSVAERVLHEGDLPLLLVRQAGSQKIE